MSIIQGDGFNVNVIISKRRKTMALKVTHKGVSIHIPSSLPIAMAETFVEQKTPWIQRKLQHQSQQQPLLRQFTDNETFFFLGESYSLRLVQKNTSATINKTPQFIELHGRLNRLSKKAIRSTLISWYKLQAEHYLNSRTALLANKIGLIPKSIVIKTYKARWGSCNSHSDIQYNWKLILAPPDIIDYVIIHELCHIQHHNHSPAFWQLVEKHYPDFKLARIWLKNNGYRLEI
jgi:predicted metal-dependent hydrolase